VSVLADLVYAIFDAITLRHFSRGGDEAMNAALSEQVDEEQDGS
jgi:hypothetical protein